MSATIGTLREVYVPRVPNYVMLKGLPTTSSIPVGDLTDSEIRDLARAWTAELIKNAERQRKNL